MKKKNSKNHKLKCKNCGSGYGYFRLKDRKFVCRICGSVGDTK